MGVREEKRKLTEERTPPEKAVKKRKGRLWYVCLVLVAGAAVLAGYLLYCMLPLDRIDLYQVEVAPRADGTLDILYDIRWTVLDSIREGPLTWVKIGMANYDFDVESFGGDVVSQRRMSGPYAAFNLNRGYRRKETARIRFQVHQERMLCKSFDGSDSAFYEFSPGWFNAIRVERYRFIWNLSGEPLSHNADHAQGGKLFWEGTLDKGETRSMEVSYPLDAFTDPELVKWRPYETGRDSGEGAGLPGVKYIVLYTLIAAFCVGMPSGGSYRHGRGYRSGGGGGGCACACAGCACACACAGGGRAGCANKDFYRPARPAVGIPDEAPGIARITENGLEPQRRF